jgi:hypothetical protein
MKPGNLREAVHRHALVRIADRRVAEAIEHHVAVALQIERARREHRDHVVGHVVVGELADHRIVRALVDVEVTDQRAGPGDAAVRRVEQADLRLLVGGDRLHHLDADLLPGRTAGDEVLLDHPLQEALAHHRGLVDLAGRRQHALGDVRRRTRRDAVDHVVRAGRVLFTQASRSRVAELP